MGCIDRLDLPRSCRGARGGEGQEEPVQEDGRPDGDDGQAGPRGPQDSRPIPHEGTALREDRNGSMPLLENAETAQCRSWTRHHRGPRPRGTNENAGSDDRGAVLGTTITYTTKMTDAPQTSWEHPGSPRGHERSSWRSDRRLLSLFLKTPSFWKGGVILTNRSRWSQDSSTTLPALLTMR